MRSIITLVISILIMVVARIWSLNTRISSYDPFLILAILGGVVFVIVDEVVQEDERLKSLSPGLLQFAAQLVSTFAIVYMLLSFVIYPAQVNGVSMSPTFASGDRVLIYLPAQPKHGEVMILHVTPEATSHFTEEYMIKRVIGLPGDRITTDGSTIYRNNTPLMESYVATDSAYRFSCFQPGNCDVIPEGYVFVMGDNRNQSVDSRSFGVVPIQDVEGRVVLNFSELLSW